MFLKNIRMFDGKVIEARLEKINYIEIEKNN